MNEINLSLFGGRLKESRKNLGLSQSDAADLTGVTREHWGRCERGMGMPGGEVFAALANAGADVRYILTGKRDFDPPCKLSSEEETMLDYFQQASKEARKAALRALLSAAPEANTPTSHRTNMSGMTQNNTADNGVQVGYAAGKVSVRKGR